jgi:hypothetical protein
VFCGDHIDCVFSHLARQLYDTLSPSVLGYFQYAKLTSIPVEVGGAMDIMNVGLVIIVAKEKTILKRRRKR